MIVAVSILVLLIVDLLISFTLVSLFVSWMTGVSLNEVFSLFKVHKDFRMVLIILTLSITGLLMLPV